MQENLLGEEVQKIFIKLVKIVFYSKQPIIILFLTLADRRIQSLEKQRQLLLAPSNLSRLPMQSASLRILLSRLTM